MPDLALTFPLPAVAVVEGAASPSLLGVLLGLKLFVTLG